MSGVALTCGLWSTVRFMLIRCFFIRVKACLYSRLVRRGGGEEGRGEGGSEGGEGRKGERREGEGRKKDVTGGERTGEYRHHGQHHREAIPSAQHFLN